MTNYNDIYNNDYYEAYGGINIPYKDNAMISGTFRLLAMYIKSNFRIKTHLDIGCAYGFLSKYMNELGYLSHGVDLPYSILDAGKKYLYPCDIAKENIHEVVPYPKYDFVTCIEVLEHIYPEDEEKAIKNVVSMANRYILFSSIADDEDEPTHVNLHDRDYWIEKFAQYGFVVSSPNFYPIPWSILFEKK